MTLYALLILLTLIVPQRELDPGEHTRMLTFGGRERSYVVYIPGDYDPDEAVPVVLAFHGGLTNADTMIRFMDLNRTADIEGFIVVYPNGTGRLRRLLTFNAGNCCGYAMNSNVDDVSFTDAVLTDLRTIANADSSRVFATGMSNGAMMAYRLASELSERIAAIAPVGGPMATDTILATRPVSVIHFHGLHDRFAPFDGGRGTGISGTEFISVNESLERWRAANLCTDAPMVTALEDAEDDGTHVTRYAWQTCADDSEVVLYAIDGGGHTWPGGPSRGRLLGTVSREISANKLMWEFFERHPMR